MDIFSLKIKFLLFWQVYKVTIILGFFSLVGVVILWRILRGGKGGVESPTLSSVPTTRREGDVIVRYVSSNDRINIILEELSAIWTKREALIRLEDLSKLWCEPEEEELLLQNVKFSNSAINEFFEAYIKGQPYFSGLSLRVVIEVLKILDERGNCPSVVIRDGEEYDKRRPKNMFEALSKIPLWRHSLNVAEEIMRLATGAGVLSPKLIIAALGHDLGKIDSFEKEIYMLGDHPRISVLILERIEGFKDLVFYQEVKSAVLNHHRSGAGFLLQKLKEADANARQREFAEVALDGGKNDEKKSVEEIVKPISGDGISDTGDILDMASPVKLKRKEDKKDKEEKESIEKDKVKQVADVNSGDDIMDELVLPKVSEDTELAVKSMIGNVLGGEGDDDLDIADAFEVKGGKGKKDLKVKKSADSDDEGFEENLTTEDREFKEKVKGRRPKKVNVDWLDLDLLIEKLGGAINKLYGEGCFNAVSVRSGYVFFLVDYFWMRIAELGHLQGEGDLIMRAEGDQMLRQDIIYSVVCRIEDELSGIATNLKKPGYFAAPFVIKFKDGTLSKRYLYIPFNAEVFGDISALEQRKTGGLLDIEDIIPSYKVKDLEVDI